LPCPQENFFFDGAQQELSKERVVLRVGASLASFLPQYLHCSFALLPAS